MAMISILLFSVVIFHSNAITIQNLPNTSNHNVAFYLQDISNNECPNKWITDIKIFNAQINDWVIPTSYTHNTQHGDRYTWDCSKSSWSYCEYILPLSILLLTNNNQSIHLVDIITDFNANTIFETTCALCTNSTQTCTTIPATSTTTSISPTNSISDSNIIIQNHFYTEEWWVAFYLNHVDTSCDKDIINVEISDNYEYNNKWVSYDPAGLIEGHYSFKWQNEENSAKYTVPISVRITTESDGVSETIYACDVITSLNRSMTFDFGTNICQDHTDEIYSVSSCDSSSTPTLFPSQSINTVSSVTNNPTINSTVYLYPTIIELSEDGNFESSSNEPVVFQYLIYIIIGGVIMWCIIILIIVCYKYRNRKSRASTNTNTMSNRSQTNTDSETSISSDKERGKEREPGICSSTIVIKINNKNIFNEGVDMNKGMTMWEDRRHSSDELYSTPKMTEMTPGITTQHVQRMGEKSLGIDHLDLNQMSSINSEQLYDVVPTKEIMTVFPNRT